MMNGHIYHIIYTYMYNTHSNLTSYLVQVRKVTGKQERIIISLDQVQTYCVDSSTDLIGRVVELAVYYYYCLLYNMQQHTLVFIDTKKVERSLESRLLRYAKCNPRSHTTAVLLYYSKYYYTYFHFPSLRDPFPDRSECIFSVSIRSYNNNKIIGATRKAPNYL